VVSSSIFFTKIWITLKKLIIMDRVKRFRGFSFPEQGMVFGNYVKSGFNHFIVYDATEDDYRYNFDGVFIPCN